MSYASAGNLHRSASLATPAGVESSHETLGQFVKRQRWWLLAVAGMFGLLFYPTIVHLVRYCLQNDDFSHCLLVPVVSAVLLYSNRRSIAGYRAGSSLVGLAILAASLGLFAVGYLRTQNIYQRVGMVGSAIGLGGFLLGTSFLRRQAFPLLYLFLALPLPYVLYQNLSIKLRDLATLVSTGMLHSSGVPVFNSGNTIFIDGEAMNVADACSGIRSLMAIIAVSVLFGYLFRAGLLRGALVVGCAVPIAILVNIMRIFLTGWLLNKFGIDLREGWIHESMGLLTFSVSLAFLYVAWLFIHWVLPGKPTPGEGSAAA